MKHIIILLSAFSLFSCSFFNETKIDVSIKNNSKKVLKSIVFKTNCDSVFIKELKPNDSFEKELLYLNSSRNKGNYPPFYSLSFFRGAIKNDDFGCTDIFETNSDKKLNLIISDNEIITDFQGIECY
jgi:hypothetical protein